jgi:hypothetical protein
MHTVPIFKAQPEITSSRKTLLITLLNSGFAFQDLFLWTGGCRLNRAPPSSILLCLQEADRHADPYCLWGPENEQTQRPPSRDFWHLLKCREWGAQGKVHDLNSLLPVWGPVRGSSKEGWREERKEGGSEREGGSGERESKI